MATVEYPHISFNPVNVPIISGTHTKVIMVVMDHIAHSWDAQEIHRQYPYLTLGQIHSALAYYYDHKAEMDIAIEQDLKKAGRLIAKIEYNQNSSSLNAKLNGVANIQDEFRSVHGGKTKDWRRTIGAFTDDDGLKKVLHEAMHFREADRQKGEIQ